MGMPFGDQCRKGSLSSFTNIQSNATKYIFSNGARRGFLPYNTRRTLWQFGWWRITTTASFRTYDDRASGTRRSKRGQIESTKWWIAAISISIGFDQNQ